MELGYGPSADGWLVVARGDLALLVRSTPERGRALLLSMAAGGRDAVLDELTTEGIRSAPPFALVEFGAESVATVLRGDVVVTTGGIALSGSGVSTWTEHVGLVRGAIRVSRTDVWGGEAVVPLSDGVVLGNAFAVDGPEVAAEAGVPVEEPVDDPVGPSEDPGVTRVMAVAPEPEAAPVPPTVSAGHYDELFGETVHRRVEDAAMRIDAAPVDAPDDDAPADAPDDDALDGRTRVAGDLKALRAARRAAREGTASAAPSPRFELVLSTGGVEALTGRIVVGRAPVASRLDGGELPRLVTMTTPNQDISRTHVEIALQGDAVVVTDLESRNGTIVTLPGQPPRRLRARESTVVIVGTVIDLGDGATMTLRAVG